MIKLIGFDLDGTFLTHDKKVTERTRETIARAAASGIECVPITGRPFDAIPKEVLALPGVNYVVAASGADIRDNRTKEAVRKDLIDRELAIEFLDSLRNAGYVAMAFLDGHGYCETEDLKKAIEWAWDDVTAEYLRQNRMEVNDLIEKVRNNSAGPEKITVNLPKDNNRNLIGLEEALEFMSPYSEKLHIVFGGNINIEASNATAFKGGALLFLGELLGIAPEEMAAFGDSGNDTDMAGCAGTFVAMANAEDCVKAVAQAETLSNDEDGVAVYIEKYILKQMV